MDQTHTDAQALTRRQAAMLRLLAIYQDGWMDPLVSPREAQTLQYFLDTATAEAAAETFTKGAYGPGSARARHTFATLRGRWLEGPGDEIGPAEWAYLLRPDAWTDADTFLAQHPEARASLDRIADLVEGFETPFGLELLATVHWVATQEGATTAEDAVQFVHAWSARKRRRFLPSQIRLAWDILHEKGWLPSVAGVSWQPTPPNAGLRT